MTAAEGRKMLVRVLSAQLSYGLIVQIDGLVNSKLTGVYDDKVSTERGINHPIRLVKPYLRPMESMTEKEGKDYKEFSSHLCDEISAKTLVDWLDENHFDYRGLIPMGLALEAPKKMYARGLDDEEIRQALIENFKFYCGDHLKTSKWGKDDDLLVTDIIAWLEKQGEQQHTNSKEDDTNEETNAPTGYGKYVDECLNEAAKHFFSEGEDKYSVADLFYAGVRCGESWLEKQREETWKPSEEQLRVLKAHLEDGAIVWGDNAKVLKTLYNK